MNSSIDQLSRDLKPVRPATSAGRATLLWASGSGLGIAAIFAAFLHLRQNWTTVSHQTPFWIIVASLLAAMIGCAVNAIRSGLPGRARNVGSEWFGPLAFAIFFVILAAESFAAPQPGVLLMDGLEPRSGLDCSLTVMILAVLPAILLGWRLRKTAPTEPMQAGIWLGVAAGASGMLGLSFCCSSENPMHLLIWHGLPVLLFGFLGGALGQRLLRW